MSQPIPRFVAIAFIALTALLAACRNEPAAVDLSDALFHDEFNVGQTGNWQLEGDDLGRATVVNGRMFIELNAPDLVQYATLVEPTVDDFILELDVTHMAGDTDGSAGVLFRMQGPDQFYRFSVTASGYYMIERREAAGSWTRLVDEWTASDAIKQGANSTNRLRVEARGSTLSFYINGEPLIQLEDGAYTSGQIALTAGTFGRPELEVAFDNVVLQQP